MIVNSENNNNATLYFYNALEGIQHSFMYSLFIEPHTNQAD